MIFENNLGYSSMLSVVCCLINLLDMLIRRTIWLGLICIN